VQVLQAARDVARDGELAAVGAGVSSLHVSLQRDLHALHVHFAVGQDLQDAHEVGVAEGEQHGSRLHSELVCGCRLLEPSDDRPVAHEDERLRPLVVVLHSSAAKKSAGDLYLKEKPILKKKT
jgi:hypothetical protein